MGLFKQTKDMKEMINAAPDRMLDAHAMMARQPAATKIVTTSLDATASITIANQTGQYVNMEPVLRLDLLVFPPGGSPPYPAVVEGPVSAQFHSRAVVGSQVRVKVDPNDRRLVWINWLA